MQLPIYWILGIFLVFIVVFIYRHYSQLQRITRESSPLVQGADKDNIVLMNERAFIIAKHPTHGFLILNAYKSKKGGEHGQLPGGRINSGERRSIAALRELLEETGMIISEDRLVPLPKIGDKFFFYLKLKDNDQVRGGSDTPMSGEPFRLKLSSEHVGFSFYKDVMEASKAVVKHSGGDPSIALERFAKETDV